jgi:Skp family chaperone for outer membrane proteins
MRRFLPIIIASLAALCAALLVISRPAANAEDQPKAADEIAVIDMDGALVKYKKYQQQNDAITVRQNALTDEIKAFEKQAEELKRKRDSFAEGSAEWWNNDREYQKAVAELENKTQHAQAEIDKMDNDLFLDVLNDIDAAMKEYCPAHSIKIVLWEKRVKLDQPTVQERANIFSQLNVLYADKELDITTAITEILNNKFDEADKTQVNPQP